MNGPDKGMMAPPQTLFGQILAYAIGGGAMTALHAGVYWGLADGVGLEPYLANLIAAIIAGFAGFELHSRWTFGKAAQGQAVDRKPRALPLFRYGVVSVIGFLLNSFWVWLFVKKMGYSVSVSVLPMIFISPWVAFALNRSWTFKQPVEVLADETG